MAESLFIECWHKIGWAEEHFNMLQDELLPYLAARPFAVSERYDSERAKYLFTLNVVNPIPQVRWALIIGDCVHNARSALDYIAWPLAGGDAADRSTLFPIYANVSDFNSSRWRLRRVHPDAVVEIGRCRPYARSYPKMHPLWLLQELDARDKHKLLSMTYSLAWGGSFYVQIAGNVEREILLHRNSLEHGAVVAEIVFPAGSPQPEMNVQRDFFFDVTFEETLIAQSGKRGILEHLTNIIEGVKDTVSRFEYFVANNPHWLFML